MKTIPSSFFRHLTRQVGIIALSMVSFAVGQENSPVVPETTNFNFYRGVVKSFVPGRSMEIESGTLNKVGTLVVPRDVVIVSASGKDLDPSAVVPGKDVTVTVRDPRDSQAPSVVRKIVVANPMRNSTTRRSLEGLVVAMRDGENVVTIRPENGQSTLSFLYNEGETEFLGGDGVNVDEDRLQAGDRILVYLETQEDGGLLAERIIFLGDSAETPYQD